MELDLSARGSKWKREEQKRREAAARKVQAERRRREAAEQARAELEREQSRRRVERLQAQEREEERALEEQRATGGIKFAHALRPVPAVHDGDKIALPASALAELDPQGAHELGVFTFELSFADAARPERVYKTHAGVLEFTAEEGTVGLPPKVAASLFEHASSGGGTPEAVQVRYVRLERGRFASLQPRGRGFGSRQVDLKQLLERALKAHTTLTTGDVVLVRHGRETFELRVVALQPEAAITILNTDLEVALLPCEAAERAKEAEAQREREAQRARGLAEHKEQRKADQMARLAPEPPAEERAQVKIALRLPDGSQATRRFLHEAPLGSVLALVEALTGDDAREFQVAARFPRRVFGADAAAKTLKELALNGRQEALFVEKVASPVAATEDVAAVSEDENVLSRVALPSEWEEARRTLERSLDAELLAAANAPAIHAMEPAMPVAQSSDREVKWRAQLSELEAMGFTDRSLNVEVLERYQGRLLRVVNFLSELPVGADGASESMEQ